jgi:hypothetical protein
MPIIETPAPQAPLSQGDILKDVNLFATGDGWKPSNGIAKQVSHKLCLVLTRPCGIEHKESVIVAAVEKLQIDVPRDIDDFKKVLLFLNGLRDGHTSPDVFYLGQLPQLSGRYGARFDALHTIQIPPIGDERIAFANAKRVGILHADFVRDLHSRLFRAVANLGFDDNAWLSDLDLKWLVDSGRTEILKRQGEVQALRTQQSGQEARGEKFDQKALSKAEAAEQELVDRMRPYEEEHQRRSQVVVPNSAAAG